MFVGCSMRCSDVGTFVGESEEYEILTAFVDTRKGAW